MFRKIGLIFIIVSLILVSGCRISGRILQDDGTGTMVGVENVLVTLSGNTPMTTTTNSSGYYEFNNLQIMNNSYLVEPMADTLRFTPTNKTVDVALSNVTDVDFTIVQGTLETYRKAIPVTAGVGAGTDYQLKINIGQSVSSQNYDLHLGGKCKPDFSDIRFTGSDQETLLSYWIENVSGNTPNRTATVWVKVTDNLDADSTIYVYYGDIEAASASNGNGTFAFFDGFENSFDTGGAAVDNAPAPLFTPTYEGSGQAIHPDVIYIPGGFAGYVYWMAMTPYPNGNDDYENPSVLASNDGINWEVPAGITNPLAPMPPCDHNNDTDIIYNTNTNELWIYYLDTRRNSICGGSTHRNYLKLIKITEGFVVSSPITVIDWDLNTTPLYLSPAVVQVDSDLFYLWYTNGSSLIYRCTSTDGINWGTPQVINLGSTSWHLNVTYVPEKNEFWMFNHTTYGGKTLNWAISEDGMNWTPYINRAVVSAGAEGAWDSTPYRGSVLYDASADELMIWYSCNSGERRTGFVSTDYSDMLALLALSDFEGWNIYKTGGSFSTSTEQIKRGNMSGKLVQDSTASAAKQIVYKPLGSTMSNFILEWDMYDDMDDTAFKLVRINGSSTVYPQTGIGVYTVASETNYAYHSRSFSYTPTSIARSLGWHKFGIKLTADSLAEYFIDEVSAATLTGQFDNGASVSIEGFPGSSPGYTTTTFFVDDIRVRKAADTEPEVGIAGSEQEGLWDLH